MNEMRSEIPTPSRRPPSGVVLVIEDNDPQRRAIQRALEVRGFEVLPARTAREACLLIEERRADIDVAVCDMVLEAPKLDPDPGAFRAPRSGSDLAELLATATARYPTEIIFFTAHSKEQFFHAALRAQAAVYLQKGDTDLHDLLRHVQILTLRRRLREQSPVVQRQLDQICLCSRSIESAVARLWRRLWIPLLEQYTGLHFAAIAQFEGHPATVIGGSLPVSQAALDVLSEVRTMLFAHSDRERFVLDPARWKAWSKGRFDLPEDLHGAVTVPMFSVTHCLLLLTGRKKASEEGPRDEAEIADLLQRYLRVVAMGHLTKIARGITEAQRKREILHLTARMCYTISHRQSDIVQAWRDLADDGTGAVSGACPDPLSRLEDLSRVLQNAASHLEGLLPDERRSPADPPEESGQLLSGKMVVWSSLDQVRRRDRANLTLDVSGDCAMWGDEADYVDVISTLFQWMAGRATGWGGGGQIRVECSEHADTSTLRISDRSRPVHERVRPDLFEPFGATVSSRDSTGNKDGTTSDLDLYVAKMIVELRLGGTITYVPLRDSTEGNCFEVSFPRNAAIYTREG